jgi:hypothetical protein
LYGLGFLYGVVLTMRLKLFLERWGEVVKTENKIEIE